MCIMMHYHLLQTFSEHAEIRWLEAGMIFTILVANQMKAIILRDLAQSPSMMHLFAL